MQYIEVGKENSKKIKLHYEDHGSGDPVLLVHGWPLNGASWEKQELALLNSGYRVITYDRRGFGDSSQPLEGYDYDTFAADLDKVIKTLELEDVTLAGFSMGTGEVTRYIGTYGTDNIKKACLLASIPPFLLKTSDNPDGVDGEGFNQIKAAIKGDRLAFLAQFLNDFYNMDLLGGKLVSKEVFQNSWNVASKASPTGTYECVDAWLTDFRKDVDAIDIPTLILHGDADRILPIDATARKLKNLIKNNKYVEIENGPHGLIWTHAEQVNQAILDFL
ncbi:Chloride peroxidase [Methanobacterium lacus]|uniref:Chloride peroxidase n=1 Tax=Methanobacterium lacus (strain AL-21) TaxID=877455 RepID=F0T997_METLA|nr:alpha/beta hydrolase [Methanobacterium lacus]ADZ09848.1 Chloride peroxidase [Methanobacterium lacus]